VKVAAILSRIDRQCAADSLMRLLAEENGKGRSNDPKYRAADLQSERYPPATGQVNGRAAKIGETTVVSEVRGAILFKLLQTVDSHSPNRCR
jgi:hypothetical protein